MRLIKKEEGDKIHISHFTYSVKYLKFMEILIKEPHY
jgi:hypothetical protein